MSARLTRRRSAAIAVVAFVLAFAVTLVARSDDPVPPPAPRTALPDMVREISAAPAARLHEVPALPASLRESPTPAPSRRPVPSAPTAVMVAETPTPTPTPAAPTATPAPAPPAPTPAPEPEESFDSSDTFDSSG